MPEGHQVSPQRGERANGAIVGPDERSESIFSPSGRERAKGAIERSKKPRLDLDLTQCRYAAALSQQERANRCPKGIRFLSIYGENARRAIERSAERSESTLSPFMKRLHKEQE